MLNLLWCLLLATRSLLNTQRKLALENLALSHQIGVLKRTLGSRRQHLNHWDRGLWVVLSRLWTGWQHVLAILQPATVRIGRVILLPVSVIIRSWLEG